MSSLRNSMVRIGALSMVDLRRLRADPGQCYVLIVLPLIMVLAITPMALAVLRVHGYANATGAEQSVPGMAALFSFMSTILLGGSFFREHEWHTWDRLRASPALPLEIVIGKCLPVFGVSLLQLALIAQEFRDVVVFRSPPPAVQNALFGALAPLARLFGYRATYPQLSRTVLAPRPQMRVEEN